MSDILPEQIYVRFVLGADEWHGSIDAGKIAATTVNGSGLILLNVDGGGWGAYICGNGSFIDLGHAGGWPDITFSVASAFNYKVGLRNDYSSARTWHVYRITRGLK